MNDRQVVVVGSEKLKISLFEKELKNINNINIKLASVPELKSIFNQIDIDLVLLDYTNLNECYIQDIYLECLGVFLLVYSVPDSALDEEFVRWKCLKGLLRNSSSVDHLCKSVDYILNGGMWMPRRSLERMINYYRTPSVFSPNIHINLTKREQQILTYLANGQTNQEIAKNLFLAESTVKTHIYKLYKKMNVHCRHDAIEQVRLLNG